MARKATHPVPKNPLRVREEHPRILEWRQFSAKMEEYIRASTIDKYKTGTVEIDVARFVPVSFFLGNILKYVVRMLNGKGKGGEILKMAHYCQLHWSESLRRGEENEATIKEDERLE